MAFSLELGRADWRNVLDELTPSEWMEWRAFNLLRPFGVDAMVRTVANGLSAILAIVSQGKVELTPDQIRPDDLATFRQAIRSAMNAQRQADEVDVDAGQLEVEATAASEVARITAGIKRLRSGR